MPSGKKKIILKGILSLLNGKLTAQSFIIQGCFWHAALNIKRDNKLKFIRYLWLFLKKRHDHNVFEKFFLNL